MLTRLLTFLKKEDGATAIEYGLIAAGISLAIVGVVYTFGDELFSLFSGLTAALQTRG